MEKMKCNKCGYKWVPRVDNPKECPNCKQMLKKVVKLAVVLFILFFAYPAHADYKFAGNWTKADTAFEASFVALAVVDWGQTHWMAKNYYFWDNKQHEEINPILGKMPSTEKVDVYFPLAIAAHVIVSMALPDKAKIFNYEVNPRRLWQYVWIGAEGYQDIANACAGVRIEF